MCITCDYHHRMPKMIQIRNVPDALHRTLKARSALAGLTLSDYLLRHLEDVAARPTLEEIQERLAGREPVELSVSLAEAVRAEREGQ